MAKSKGGVTVAKVWELCEPIVTGLGLSVWDVRYVKEGAQWYLRIFIDKPGGVDINDFVNKDTNVITLRSVLRASSASWFATSTLRSTSAPTCW